MVSQDQQTVSLILHAAQNGDKGASDRLFKAVYAELHRMAHRQMVGRRPVDSLQSIELVHEAYLRLVPDDQRSWENRRHFFGAAASAMRQILVDRARKRGAVRHGGELRRASFDDPPDAAPSVDMLALDEALDRLASKDERKALVVSHRYFLGLTVPETAELLDVSPRTVDSDWKLARAWLKRELGKKDPSHDER
jgi:RNA polymerase sigma factor (TIGR02999 family)